MKIVDMKYSFMRDKEPSIKQLSQLMQEACDDAIQRRKNAEEKYFKQLKIMIQEAKEKYIKMHGNS